MEEEQEQVSDQSNLYSLLEVVWHLCEILFIEVLPAGCQYALLEWSSGHTSFHDRRHVPDSDHIYSSSNIT